MHEGVYDTENLECTRLAVTPNIKKVVRGPGCRETQDFLLFQLSSREALRVACLPDNLMNKG